MIALHTPVRRAVLLVAGRGTRLGDITKERPKCLVEVAGLSILERALDALAESGVEHIVLVVGFHAEQVVAAVGHEYRGMRVTYVDNTRYAETNTSYSLWLAREHLDRPLFLIEGDIVFEDAIVKRMIRVTEDESVWAAIPVAPDRDEGILLEETDDGHIGRVERILEAPDRPPHLSHKCAGIQLLTRDLALAMAGRLDRAVQEGEIRKFADLLLADLIPENPVRLCSVEGTRWSEIDDAADLETAHEVFVSEPALKKAGGA